VQLSSSWSKKAGLIGWHREKQGKSERSKKQREIATRACSSVTISSLNYQYQNWQTQKRRIAEFTQPR
jgi:hypothetical protein